MSIQRKHKFINLLVVMLFTPFLATPSFADMDDMHGMMMRQRGMQGSSGYNCNGMGMMGRGMGMMGGGMMPMMGGMGMMSPMMTQLLDLDDKQRAKIRDIRRTQRKAHIEMMTSMMDIHDEIEAAYDKDTPDAKTVGKLYGKMFEKKRQMIEQMIEVRNKIRDVLTDEQKKRFDNMGHGGMGMMGGGMGRMNMMGGMGMME